MSAAAPRASWRQRLQAAWLTRGWPACSLWPLSVVFLDRTLMLLAWCGLRQDFRRFHLHRMTDVVATGASFRPRRVPLLREFLAELRQGGNSGTARPVDQESDPDRDSTDDRRR